MDRTKISKRRKTSLLGTQRKQLKTRRASKKRGDAGFILQEEANLKEYDPVKNLLNINKMGVAIMQCFIENDPDGVLEIIEGYLYALNKTQFLKEAKVPRSTAYNFFRRRNPTIKTLAKIIHASSY